jgi:hypothetical protein
MIVLGQCRAPAVRGSDKFFPGFSPGKTTPRDLYQTTVIAKTAHASTGCGKVILLKGTGFS